MYCSICNKFLKEHDFTFKFGKLTCNSCHTKVLKYYNDEKIQNKTTIRLLLEVWYLKTYIFIKEQIRRFKK